MNTNRDKEKEERHQTLWVIGDSTLSSFEDKYYYPRYGYGTKLDCYLDQHIRVENLALSGRSSKSYTTEPEYQRLLQDMKSGDFLLIGFGHNDEKTEEARYTNANGGFTEVGSFAHSLYENYIMKARQAGCSVILCTPIVRRRVAGEWKPQDLHISQDTADFPGGDYAQAVRRLGNELTIPVVDMTQITKELYEKLGAQQTLYMHAWPSNKPASVDNTHTNIWGAQVNAYHVMKEISKLQVEGLCEHVINLDQDVPFPDMQTYLHSNPAYVPTVYSGNLKQSTLWEETQGFHATVFGDIMEVPAKEHFTLEKVTDTVVDGFEVANGIHIAVRNNVGKISANSDGIAMFYQKVPVDQPFTFQADVIIHDYFLNDQVSFGLMVRDDMYIDQTTSDTLGDYVAAAPLMLTHGETAWNCFARKSGVLTQGGTCSRAYHPGEKVSLKIESTMDGYACTFGEEKVVTGGFDFKLTSIDPDYVYVGVFAARNADVIFTNIELKNSSHS